MSTSFRCGIGLVTLPPTKDRYHNRKMEEWAANNGVYPKTSFNHSCVGDPVFFPSKRRIIPNSKSVMECLISDTEVLDYTDFEDWASSFGYDEDSLSAFRTYEECLKLSLVFKNGLGGKFDILKDIIKKENE
ncbi:MAG: hypothetical protein KDH96_06900 [Candidatus Riesia sp.]|nr:hypothetical protein [Candidatus Riesia sp.]